MTSRPLTFVVGTGRCGSTALSGVLRLHPDILSVNELFAALAPTALPEQPLDGAQFWSMLAEPRAFATRMIRCGVPLPEFLYPACAGRFSAEDGGIPAIALMTLPHLTDDPDALYDALAPRLAARPTGPVAGHYRALFDALAERCGGRAVVERSGYSLRSVPDLHRAFPEARFVHLFRNGPDCALSMSRHPGFRLIQLMRDAAGDGAEGLPAELARLAAGAEQDPRVLLELRQPVADFGGLWSDTVLEGLAHLDAVPAGLRTSLAYEDLVGDPRRELVRLAAHVGVDPLPQWLDAAARHLDGRRGGAADRLPAAERAALYASCAPGTKALAA
ncbi:sulfotransferase [Streptantibioticus silvisoli]|uniref:Sulfotransferase n=1 Tax=Streptantibioticus silvisoli TaxID=2705255 RepID=A0ABT6W914_9ACTN|nr:sulfotransferase [Streptantibioticus silvisoli]MDI5967252.1 sulfotransferase [Streptantibioticus silvisoli]